MITEDHYRCRTCKCVLPRSEFYADKNRRTGVQSACKTCTKRHVSLNYRARNCSITEDEVEVFLQIPCCQVCGRQFANEYTSKFDHHHGTGKFRGVLCNRCNTAMHAVDDGGLLAALMAYRDRHLERA